MNMIGLYNLEPQYTNIALEKVRLFYTGRGERIEDYLPLERDKYDIVYCSSIFTWTNKSYVMPDMICGGTGFNLETTLDPAIDKMKPKINVGFTTRGCIRKCSFCVVHEKEGHIRAVGDIYDFWDGQSGNIRLIDNNILALPVHFEMICGQLKKEDLKVDLTHGLDIRLLNEHMLELLKSIRHEEYHFAFDNVKNEKAIRRGVGLLKDGGINQSIFYVLVGYDSTPEEDLYRCNVLKELNQRAYVMKYNKMQSDFTNALASWANNRMFFMKVSFREWVKNNRKKHKAILGVL